MFVSSGKKLNPTDKIFNSGEKKSPLAYLCLTQTIETTPVTVLLISGVKAVRVPYGAFMCGDEVKLSISCYQISCGEHGLVISISEKQQITTNFWESFVQGLDEGKHGGPTRMLRFLGRVPTQVPGVSEPANILLYTKTVFV